MDYTFAGLRRTEGCAAVSSVLAARMGRTGYRTPNLDRGSKGAILSTVNTSKHQTQTSQNRLEVMDMCKRWLYSMLILGFSLSLSAQTSPVQKADIEPGAMAALGKMGTYLRTLKAFQVKAVETVDDVLDNGQTVQSNRVIDMVAVRPNRFRVDIKSDDKNPILFYDGKNFTVYASLLNYYATVPAPPTIAEVIKHVQEKFDIDFPLVDLFYWGAPESTEAQEITSALDIGPSSVEGITCEQYAFRQNGLDWQIWIQQGDYPLPRKLILITTDEDARPRFTQVLTWNLAPSFNDEAFTFDPPQDAQKIAIAEVVPSASSDKKSEKGGVQ